jgi:6-phosphofructokinase
MRTAVLTSGGDAPGMNGVVRVLGWEVLGVADGGAAGEALDRAGVEGVVVVGGGGSLRGALRLEKLEVPAVGPSRANSGPPTRDSGRA